MQVREAIGEYLASIRIQPKTTSEKNRMLGQFATWCESKELELESLKAKMLNEYTGYLFTSLQSKQGGRVSSHTVALHIRTLKAFLHWCALDEDFEQYVKFSMVARIESPKKEVKIVETFTDAQVKALFKACEQGGSEHIIQRDKAILSLLFDTGIRAAELCDLCLDQVEVTSTDPHIRVFGKGSKWREVSLGSRSRKELWRYINRYRKAERGIHTPVFLTYKKTPLGIGGLEDVIEKQGKRAGIKNVRCSPHTCRHTFAVTFMRNGGDIYRLSKIMGHTSVAVTENYLKSLNPGEARRGMLSPFDASWKENQ